MLKLSGKILLFLALNVLLLVAVLGLMNRQVEKHEFNNWTTEANLLHMDEDKHYDLLILGTSHARSLSRSRNHQRIENILGKKILNLSQGLGKGGLLNQYAFLKYFYHSDNSANTIIYFLDPFVFYNRYFDSKDKLFSYEPVRFSFLAIIATMDFDPGVLYTYLYSKFTKDWLRHRPYSGKSIHWEIQTVNAVSVFKRYNVVYPDNIDTVTFKKKKKLIKDIVGYIKKKQNTRVIFVVLPSLIKWPGHEAMLNILEKIEKEEGIPYYDFSTVMMEKEYYKDHDHLNTKGVEHFTKEFLKPLLEGPAKIPPHNHR